MFTFSLPLMILYTLSCWMTGYFFRKCTRENTSDRNQQTDNRHNERPNPLPVPKIESDA